MQKIYIKNMVCDRCIMVVKGILSRLDMAVNSISLGEVNLAVSIDKNQIATLRKELEDVGFEMIDDSRSRTIEQIKNCIRDLVHKKEGALKINLSAYIAGELNHDYAFLSSLFSEVESTTIEKYYIAQKIEKVKELLVYDNLSLGEIAHQLNYSSTAHLSSQFKKVTGLTPTYYKQFSDKHRKSIDKV